MEKTRVELPPGVGNQFEVYVNGVPQHESRDFVREGNALVFPRALGREGQLGFWRWASLFLGIAGTYRKNDNVDVVYQSAAGRVHATGLPMTVSTAVEDTP